jgi:hypothetical protein
MPPGAKFMTHNSLEPTPVFPSHRAAPELGAALAARWVELDSADRQRQLVLIAHGPTAEAEAERWIANVSQAAIPELHRAGLRAEARSGLLRDDVCRNACRSGTDAEGFGVLQGVG